MNNIDLDGFDRQSLKLLSNKLRKYAAQGSIPDTDFEQLDSAIALLLSLRMRYLQEGQSARRAELDQVLSTLLQ